MLTILHSGTGWLAIDKPSGIPVHGDPAGNDILTQIKRQEDLPFAAAPHRLDRGTSGCLLIATAPETLRALAHIFAQRRILKTYHAWVVGRPHWDKREVFTHLAVSATGGPTTIVPPGAGPPAITLLYTIHRDSDRSLIECQPLTGRTHQIRAHLRHIGHPILGDPIYARPHQPPAPRLMLHATSLLLPDPTTGTPTRILSLGGMKAKPDF